MIQYQAYWSALVDLLLYIASNVMELTGKMVMGYVLYCSHENNGTFLPVGRIHMALRSPRKREKFRKSVLEHGMYSTLVARNLRLMLLNGKGQYSASGHPRHIANNRGGNKIPVLGDASLPTPRNEKECNIVSRNFQVFVQKGSRISLTSAINIKSSTNQVRKGSGGASNRSDRHWMNMQTVSSKV